jgi:hypothetical protein
MRLLHALWDWWCARRRRKRIEAWLRGQLGGQGASEPKSSANSGVIRGTIGGPMLRPDRE